MFRRARTRGFGGPVAIALGAVLVAGLTPGLAEEASAQPRPQRVLTEDGDPKQPSAFSEDEALAEAKRSGESVEVLSLRGESSDVYATPDGQLEAREYLRPVRTRVKGKWQPVDTGLAATSDGAVAPKATTVGLEFSGGGDAPLVRMEKAGRELALTWPGELPEPRLDGDTATYPEVLPGVDLRMGAQEDGFTQLLVVKSAQAAASPELAELRLSLAADGMDVRKTAQGGLEAVDDGAKGVVFEAPTPLMWDSSTGGTGKAAAQKASAQETAAETGQADGEPGAAESGKLAPLDVEVPEDGSELVLTPDQEVLRGADTVYPVFIDPQWYSPRASAWTMASKYWASSPQWKFNGEPDSGMGYCGWNYCKPNDTKRLFYRIPVSKFAGKSILSAEFVVRNVWSASCSARGVQLWRTKGISSSTTWNSQNNSDFWIDHLKTESFAHGYTGCAAKDAEFNVKSAVQQAANGKWSTMTFGLRASSETDRYGWKRFSDKAFLRVKYNRPPYQLKMSQLTMEYGGTCKRPADAARVRSLGTIRASDVTDPDGDNVAVQFQAKWDAGDGKGLIARWKPSLSTYKKSGSSFSIKLPTTIPRNTQIHWYARVRDTDSTGYGNYSPWSYAGDPTGCYFVYDTNEPKAPAVSSGEYPASDPENPDDPWYDGVGQYGTFMVDSSSTDVTRYRYGLNSDPLPSNQVTTSGGDARAIDLLPAKPGANFVTVMSFDAAGNGSEISTYHFRVKAGQPERATWQMDEETGAAQAEGSTPARTATLHGGATPGAAGKKGTAVEFDGTDDYAATDIPVVDTSRGFAVSAWVKLSAMPGRAAIVAAQPGNHSPGFELYYSQAFDRWVFNQYAADQAGAGIVRAMADTPGGVSTGTWTHLVGSYDSARDMLELFVDGTLVGQTPYATPWNARRGLTIGAGSYNGTTGNFFPGAIDDLQLFDKPLTANEVGKLGAHQQVGDPGRPAVAVFPLDEEADATEITGHGDVLPARPHGGVTPGEPGVAGKAAHFNGTDAYARIGQTSGPHVNTARSFTISAWAKLDDKPDRAAIIAAQAGRARPGFELYYSAANDRWAVNQYASDSAGSGLIRAMQPEGTTAHAGQWTHLAGVHDTVADTLTLYVNGTKAGSTTLEGAFYANQSMYLGAGSYSGVMGNFFPGAIDDVRLFDRPASAAEIQQLFKQRPLVKGRWNFESTDGTSPVTTPDSSPEGRPMTLHGGAVGGMDSWIGFGSLELDGVDDYAATDVVPVDTSASFTATAWAKAAAIPEAPVTLLSAEGSHQNAFVVRYLPDDDPEHPGRWQITVSEADSAGSPVASMENEASFYDAQSWNHLALVYDGFSKEARLYVNGTLEEVACVDADDDGNADNASCTDRIPWAENVLSFKATGALQVGRTTDAGAGREYWPGLVDDVWAFQGALSDAQVSYLVDQVHGVPTEVPDTD
ncbi:LamG-like jellyroll fold domain-containing protein [Streptomyces fenghuangensis]